MNEKESEYEEEVMDVEEGAGRNEASVRRFLCHAPN